MMARLYLAGGIALALLVAAGAIYMAGGRDEAAQGESKNLRATERQRAERDETDAEIRQLDHSGICHLLDGVWRNGLCD